MPVSTATNISVPTAPPGMNTAVPRVPPTGSHATRPPTLHVESAHMPSPMRDTAATPHARRSPQFLDHGAHEFSVGPRLHEHGTSHISPRLDNSNKSTTHASGIVYQYPRGSDAPRSDSNLPIDRLIHLGHQQNMARKCRHVPPFVADFHLVVVVTRHNTLVTALINICLLRHTYQVLYLLLQWIQYRHAIILFGLGQWMASINQKH